MLRPRALFNELEFTTLLKELAPAIDATRAELIRCADRGGVRQVLLRSEGWLCHRRRCTFLEALTEQVSEAQTEAVEEEAPMLQNLSLLDAIEDAECREAAAERDHCVAVSAENGRALRMSLTRRMRAAQELLEDATVPKSVHDLKATVRVLDAHGIAIAMCVTMI